METGRTLDELLANGLIRLRRGSILDMMPAPLPPDFDFDRVEGMMLGLAIGDGLGNTTEGKLPGRRRECHGEIRDYLANHHADDRRVGLPSDDTQMAFWTLEQLLEDNGLDPDHVAARFCRDRIFGIGSSVERFVAAYRRGDRPWYECGQPSAGNGALMRIAPALIPHLRNPSPALWADTALLAMITHNDSASISACMAFVRMLWDLLRMDGPPSPEWWVETYVKTSSEVETDTHYDPGGEGFKGYRGPLSGFVQEHVPQAYRSGLTVLDACERWYSAAYLLETVPCVLYILTRHGHEPEEAIVRAVNDTKDNDTVAAIVGAAIGALHGKSALPVRWRENLLGRLTANDDGHVFELLARARERWAPRPAVDY